MTTDNEELLERIKTLEDKIQNDSVGKSNSEKIKELQDTVHELEQVVNRLDRNYTSLSSKDDIFSFRLSQLDDIVKEIKNTDSTSQKHTQDNVEKIILMILSAAVAYLFNNFGKW